MNKVWQAKLENGFYTFEAIGTTRNNAIEALRIGWNEHAAYSARNGRPLAAFDEVVGKGLDILVLERELNQGYRDGEPCGPAVDITGQYQPPPDPDKLTLSQLHAILQAVQKAKDDFAKGAVGRDYKPGSAEFKAYHMAYNLEANPFARPY